MLPKAYDPKAVEDRIYKMWEESGAFKANVNSGKEPFTISMPLPNATGQLHLGHAVMLSLQDIFTRFNRMRGREALWVPGTDHAAIATENVVIKKIQQEENIKDPRAHYGRENILKKIVEFVGSSQGIIRGQIRKMGSSCDWSREAYTMDKPRFRCVYETFKKMYSAGLIYRGHRIVNWDPKLQTNVSDDEVAYVTRKDPFYWFQYGPFQIGTVRPETKFGDKYVVMHPDDERYKKYKHGDTFECEWINGKITATVIKDEAIDMKMGTGCMTITPWHTQVDFDIAERHGLEKEQIIDFDGRLLPVAGEFAGLHIDEARPRVLERLKEKGLLVKTDEDYEHAVATNSRGGGIIEPQIREQWFIDVNKKAVPWKKRTMSLKQVMQDVIKSGDVKIIPERFEKVYFHWIDNLRDWCISRQIWWGHRIPVWYKDNEIYVDIQPPKDNGWEQDPDTLDTWFSSALWTWSTLIDPDLAEDYSLSFEEILKQSPDFFKFHPTAVMETGYDILFFWVARMILMTSFMIGDIPFKHVYLHGMVRTREGKKMSKSHPETCIDPLEIIPEYGADALRLSMIVGQSPGNDFRLYKEKIAGYRNFVNKLWNASRFVLMTCEQEKVDPKKVCHGERVAPSGDEGRTATNLSLADRALLSALQDLINDVTQGLQNYRLSETGERLYSFVWDYFCDWYLELSKGEANPEVLIHALRTILILLHPYCPFVTEELWEQVKPKGAGMLIKETWPQADSSQKDQAAYNQLQTVIKTISAIRKLRSDQGIEPGKKVNVIIHSKPFKDLLTSQKDHICKLVKIEDLRIDDRPAKHEDSASVFLHDIEIHLSLEGLIDKEAEKQKLEAERDQLINFINSINKKLENKQFVKNAPDDVVQKEIEKLASNQQKLKKIEERLASL